MAQNEHEHQDFLSNPITGRFMDSVLENRSGLGIGIRLPTESLFQGTSTSAVANSNSNLNLDMMRDTKNTFSLNTKEMDDGITWGGDQEIIAEPIKQHHSGQGGQVHNKWAGVDIKTNSRGLFMEDLYGLPYQSLAIDRDSLRRESLRRYEINNTHRYYGPRRLTDSTGSLIAELQNLIDDMESGRVIPDEVMTYVHPNGTRELKVTYRGY
jgi:hypothetical protein